jgi:ER membrane protein complex subunit 4
MALAWSPGKSLLTTAFMLYMSGTSIQLFSIMTTGMALFTPVKAIAGIQDTFKEFKKEDGVDTRMPTLLYLGFQLLSLAVALYQCSRMGLLPVTSADWTSFIPAKNILEHSGIPI